MNNPNFLSPKKLMESSLFGETSKSYSTTFQMSQTNSVFQSNNKYKMPKLANNKIK